MTKISDYNTALKLSQITGRPLEDFYAAPTETPALEARSVESTSSSEIMEDTPETGDSEESGLCVDKTRDECNVDRATELQRLAEQYNAKIVNDKILHGRQMTRKEFLAEKKKFKTRDDFWKSPLIYKMFRAEGQLTASFLEFCNKIEKELE